VIRAIDGDIDVTILQLLSARDVLLCLEIDELLRSRWKTHVSELLCHDVQDVVPRRSVTLAQQHLEVSTKWMCQWDEYKMNGSMG